MIKTVILGDLINIKSGKSRPKESGVFPVYGGNGIFGNAPLANINHEAIIVGRVGAYCGSVYIENSPFWLSDNALGVTAKAGVSLLYIYYLLKFINLNKMAIGGAQPLLTQGILNNISVAIPNFDEQKKIADILGILDQKIELNRKMNETLEKMGQALFRHYFIDNPDVSKWDTGLFSDLSNITTGKGSVKSQMSDDGAVPLYGANGIMGTSKDYLYDEPLVITGRVGTLGAVRIVTGKSWFSDNVIIIQPKIGYLGFVYHITRSFDFISMNRGSTQPLITQTDLKNIRISIPNINVLKKFETEYSNIFGLLQSNLEEIETIAVLRDALLPQLLSGRIKI